jgi:molybdopterin synthase sulfur carrier subunit
MRLTIRLFASHREALGLSTLQTELPDGITAADAFARLVADHPALAASARSVAFAVNREHVSPETTLHDGDELALLPPVAGG